MNEFIIKIKNKIKGFISFKKVNPHTHWRNLLYVFFIVVVLLILFSFFILYKIKNQQIFQIIPTSSESPILLNEKLLKRVTDSFNNKQIIEKQIKEGLILFKDPSLD